MGDGTIAMPSPVAGYVKIGLIHKLEIVNPHCRNTAGEEVAVTAGRAYNHDVRNLDIRFEVSQRYFEFHHSVAGCGLGENLLAVSDDIRGVLVKELAFALLGLDDYGVCTRTVLGRICLGVVGEQCNVYDTGVGIALGYGRRSAIADVLDGSGSILDVALESLRTRAEAATPAEDTVRTFGGDILANEGITGCKFAYGADADKLRCKFGAVIALTSLSGVVIFLLMVAEPWLPLSHHIS